MLLPQTGGQPPVIAATIVVTITPDARLNYRKLIAYSSIALRDIARELRDLRSPHVCSVNLASEAVVIEVPSTDCWSSFGRQLHEVVVKLANHNNITFLGGHAIGL